MTTPVCPIFPDGGHVFLEETDACQWCGATRPYVTGEAYRTVAGMAYRGDTLAEEVLLGAARTHVELEAFADERGERYEPLSCPWCAGTGRRTAIITDSHGRPRPLHFECDHR